MNGSNVCPSVTVKKQIEVFTFSPTINQPATTTRCQGETIDLSANPNGSGDFSFNWTRNGQPAGSGASIPATEEGVYKVTVKPNGNACPEKISTNEIRLHFDTPIEDQEIVPSKPSRVICGAPQETSITLTAQPGGIDYQWYREEGGFDANGQTATVSQGGKYVVNLSRGTCKRQKSIEVYDNSFDPNIASAPDAFCSDAPITLTAHANDPGRFDYAWRREGNPVGGNAPTLSLPTELGTFRYYVEITSRGSGCNPKRSQELAIRVDRAISGQKITLPSGKERAIICGAPQETAIDLTATADAPTEGIAYQWQGSGGGNTPTIKAGQAGDYRVVFSRGVCSRDASVRVESGAFSPTIRIESATLVPSPTEARICQGQTARLASSVSETVFDNSTENYSYEWLGGPNATTVLANQRENTLSVTATGQYGLRMTLIGSGCQARTASPQKIQVTTDPAIRNPRLTPDPAIICNKATGLTITALTDSSAGIAYQWSGGGRAGASPSEYIVSNAGTYQVTMSRGACTATASVSPREEELKVDVTPPTTSNPLLLCSGANGIPMELKATSNLSTAVIKWLRDNGAEAPGNNTGPTYTPTQTGVYYATANFNNICLATSPQRIATEALASFAVNITPATLPAQCDDRPLTLSAQPSEPRFAALYNYRWVQDTVLIKQGQGPAGNSLTTGKVVNYPGNSLILGNEANFTLLITKDGCQASSSPTKITLKPARSGIIVLDFNTLQATESSDGLYQWFFKAGRAGSLTDTSGYQPFTSATNRLLLGAEPGSYLVRANRNGCGSKFSFAYIVDQVTAVVSPLADTWRIYPNPTADLLKVERPQSSAGRVIVRILDTSGRILIQEEQSEREGSYSLQPLPVGVYLLEIQDGPVRIIRKILHQ